MKRLLRHLKPYTGYIIGVLLLVFFQSLAELYLPTLMSDIVDTGIVQGNTNYILKIGGFMLLVAALGTICAILASYFSSKTAMGFGSILRAQVFERVEDYSLSEFEQFGTASLITRTTNDITQLQQVVMVMLRMMLSAPMMAIGGIIMAISLDAKLSLVIVVIMPIITLAIMILTRKSVPLFNKLQEKLDHLNLVVRENLTGMRVIRAFNKTEHEKKRFNNANKDLTETALRVYKMMALLMPLMMLLLNLGILALVWFGSIRIDNGSMQVGQLMAFIQYVMHIMFSFIMVSMLFVMIPRASASAARINEVLDVVPEMQDPQEEKKIINLAGHLEFRNVTFSYPGAEKPVLKDISFSVRPGETVAFIGGTGSGKSTLVDLILRFYDIDEGNILLNGVDIRDISQENLRKRIGYVPQKALLFNGTIRENIRYGNLEATDEEIKQAAEIAQALEFISDMPDGFDSMVSQGGTNLSGGQKQRLSIARAIVRKPEIYVFDDSFSALDFKTDAKLRAALNKEIENATVLIVAQRVSTIMNADKILVLENGQIAGMGKHRELLNTCEVYREIVSSQLSEEELA